MKARYLNSFTDFGFKNFQHTILERAFEIAELAHLTEDERKAYEDSLKHYRDILNIVDTARGEGKEAGFIEGKEVGKMEGKIESATKMKADGIPVNKIAEYTGLSAAEIERLS